MKHVKKIVYAVAYLTVFALAFVLLKEDAGAFLKWWLAVFLMGLTFLPMTAYMFRNFHDRGYLFSKVIGIALSGYLLWLLSSMKLLKFTSWNGIVCIFLLLIPNAYIIYVTRKKNNRVEPLFTKEAIGSFLKEELLFLLLFLVWCYIKGFKAAAYGTEKFMDYGFMTSMMRAKFMPPYDFWYSGGVINYYYFGQYLATFVTKVSGVTVNVGYNLMLMTIASLSTLLPYSIVYQVTSNMLKKKKQEKRWLPVASGTLAGLLLSCSSNMHFPIFRWFVPALQEMLGLEVSSYWFPDATRYIGYQPETADKTIHEFPAYSIVLGDLHAHYINIIFVITVVGLLFAWYIRQDQMREKMKGMIHQKLTSKTYLQEVFEPNLILITFFIGMFHMTNFWDFPIYFVVSGAVILCSNAVKYQFRLATIKVTALQGIFVLLGSTIVALPFTLNFDQISTEICLATNHTPFYQLMILWGLPILIMVGFISSCIYNYKKKEKPLCMSRYEMEIGRGEELREANWKEATSNRRELYQNESKPSIWGTFQSFMLNLDFTDLFIILLGLCAIGLVLMPEVIYVKDIYNGDYKRANTMFKLTYQAFIMFSMCSGYILMKQLVLGTTARQKRSARVALILSCLTISYVGHSIHAWFGNVFDFDARKTLDAAAFMEEKMPEDYEAVQWLNENVEGQKVVLEANGDSYSDYERVSVITGLQTVAGWYVHEWLWRGDTASLNQRNEDIKTIYTSRDYATVKALVEQYDIDYIYVGNLEREKFGTVADDILESLGDIVFATENKVDHQDSTYIVKVNK